MTVSKSQPMRPAEIDLIDAVNENSSGIENLGTDKADAFTVSLPITYSNDVIGFKSPAVNVKSTDGTLSAWRETGSLSENAGAASHAEGNSTIASGDNSHAEGNSTTASGNDSHSEGRNTVAGPSHSSHAEGENTTASGQGAHAEGYNTTASGFVSHAEGYDSVASKNQSHAEGYGTKASGSNSHAEGNSTTASGSYSHAEGMNTTASSSYSHAEGMNTKASLGGAHAEGYFTTASGSYSHAEGMSTTASGYCSHAEGSDTTANHLAQHVFGIYNVADPSTAAASSRGTYVEIVGNGRSSVVTSNARTLDWSGNQWTAGDITCDAVQGNHNNLYSLRSIGAIVASTPSMEYGTSNSVSVGAGSHTVVDITFGSSKTEVPVVFPSIQCATSGVNLIATVQSVSNSQCAICVTNLGTTDVSDVTIDYLAIYGR